MIDVDRVRNDFPLLQQQVYGKPLIYLDNAATTQKPVNVLDRVSEFYRKENSNIHRGVHLLSEQASEAYENARVAVQHFLKAGHAHEILFTRGTTESINLVAYSFGQAFVGAGDEIIISVMEHHSNIIPWQLLCERTGATLKVIPLTESLELDLDAFEDLISEKTKLVALTWVSNVTGVINPVRQVIETAHEHDVPVLIDAAQAIQHMPVDVTSLDCDFLAFSGHKIYAETGIGVLYGKEKWLDRMPPWQGGGGMIEKVTLEKTTYASLPLKFEAGTTNIGATISLHAALEYVQSLGITEIASYEQKLLRYAVDGLGRCEGLNVYADVPSRGGAVSLSLDGIHPYDAGAVLDKLGIAVRTGTMCAEPLMRHLGVKGALRASIVFYNTRWEIDRLIEAIPRVQALLGR
ncbi:MAG: SufS family cysteine desulfurase [Chitinivibrionales bacterium]|nr:SufS family cysteine desulfurase [Chitinivibrionales bacterium]